MTAKKQEKEKPVQDQEQELQGGKDQASEQASETNEQSDEQSVEQINQGEQQSVKQGEELVITPLQEEVIDNELAERLAKLEHWKPVTALGKAVKQGAVRNIDEILKQGKIILEPEIVDALLDLKAELLLIGQAKGKFGGGKRRAFRSTQKKTAEGNKPRFEAMVVVGDGDSHVGIGYGKSKDTLPAREKALRNAKLNIFKVVKGCGSWECSCKTPHSVPFKVEGKVGSVRVEILPAPKGNGLVAESEVKKILSLAGIQDAWVNVYGQARNKINLVKATEKALRKLYAMRIKPEHVEVLSIQK